MVDVREYHVVCFGEDITKAPPCDDGGMVTAPGIHIVAAAMTCKPT